MRSTPTRSSAPACGQPSSPVSGGVKTRIPNICNPPGGIRKMGSGPPPAKARSVPFSGAMSNAHGALWEADICAIYGAADTGLGVSTMLRPASELFSGAELDGAPAVLLMDGSLLTHLDELRRLPRH